MKIQSRLSGAHRPADANTGFRESKKYADVVVANAKWQRDNSRSEAATWKIAEETKSFNMRRLVPRDQVKAQVNEQVAVRTRKQMGS